MKKTLRAFDLDYTLLSVNSSFRFGAFLFKKGVFSSFTMIQLVTFFWAHRLGFLSMQALHDKIFSRLFLGKSSALFTDYVENFLDEHFESFINPKVIALLRSAQDRNDHVVILSNGPDFLVSACAKRFGVVLFEGSRYSVDKKGNFDRISNLLLGNDKASYVRAMAENLNLCKNDLYAYSDSIHDLSFLEAAGVPIAVNPDAKLRQICKERQWQIL